MKTKRLNVLLSLVLAGSLTLLPCNYALALEDNAADGTTTNAQNTENRLEITYENLIAGEYDIDASFEYETVEIKTEEDLYNIANECKLDSWSRDKRIVLNNDIKLVNHRDVVIPIFAGEFDGNGHSITGLLLDGNISDTGFIRYIQRTGYVHDLTLSGEVFAEGKATTVGMLVGINFGKIENCKVSGILFAQSIVGGVAGENYGGASIIGCTNEAEISGTHSAGGIAGVNDGLIMECTNSAQINTEATDTSIDISEISLQDFRKINSTFEINSFTDIGGIAGISCGVIALSKNTANIGYQHIGYNIGGIAGRLSGGFIENCENTGDVQGRKDVGGIVGQFEPYMQAEYVVDGVGQLESEVNALLDIMDRTADDTENYGEEAGDLLGEISDKLADSNGISEELPSKDDDISASEMKDKINSMSDSMKSMQENMDIIAEYSDQLGDLIKDSTDDLSADMRAMVNQTRRISNLATSISEDISSYAGVDYSDASGEKADYLLGEENGKFDAGDIAALDVAPAGRGRIVGCNNKAIIGADSAVGGIVGRIAVEYDADPESDVEFLGSSTTYVNASAKATVVNCENYGDVSSKKDYAGGIVGYAQYGYVICCNNVADIKSQSGSYVGGISGLCNNTVLSCYARAVVSGKDNIGGITGFGTNIKYCAANTLLYPEGKKAGCISGDVSKEGVVLSNYYVNSEYEGIDGASFLNMTSSLSYDDFAAIENLPKDQGEFIITEEVKEDNMVTSITSDLCLGEDNAQPFMYAVGSFVEGTTLEVVALGNEYSYKIVGPENGMSQTDNPCKIRVAKTGKDDMLIEVMTGSEWKIVDAKTIGSYAEFDATNEGVIRISYVKDYKIIFIAIAVVAVVLIIVLLAVITQNIKKAKKKMALKKRPKAVIFDLDGTLIDTEKYYRKVWPEAALHYGYHMTDEQALELRSLGRPFAPRKLSEWFGDEFDYETVRNYRRELFNECIEKEGISLKPGVMELLQELKKQGITIAIATATDVHRSQRYLKLTGVIDYIDRICSAANAKEGKPSPDVYLQACSQLKLKPEECFAVEDSPNGIMSAAAAGCRVIFVPDQTEEEPEAEKMIFAKVKTADEIIGLL